MNTSGRLAARPDGLAHLAVGGRGDLGPVDLGEHAQHVGPEVAAADLGLLGVDLRLWPMVLVQFVAGWTLGWLRHRTGSVGPCGNP